MSQIVTLSEDTEINGVFRRAGEFVAVPNSFDQAKIRRKVADTANIERQNKRDLATFRIPKILQRAPGASRDALSAYLGRFPNDINEFRRFDFAIITPGLVDDFIEALQNHPVKSGNCLKIQTGLIKF